jgi:hypothetical protein
MSKFNQMADRLLELPNEISDLQLQILDRTDIVNATQNRIQVIESKIKSDINNAVDANGKKVYSNEESRKAAFIEDAAENSELKELNDIVADQQRMIQEKRIAVEALSNEQRNIRTLLHFFANSQELVD